MRSALMLTVLAGCAQDTRLPDDEGDRARHERFVGRWLVDQPTHALYEATLYAFEADGTLRALASGPPDCSGHLARDCVTGVVARPDGPRCRFGDRWWSEDAETLVIQSSCDDGAQRDVRLRVGPDAGVTVLSVDGEPGWAHDGWPWRWAKCGDAERCLESPSTGR